MNKKSFLFYFKHALRLIGVALVYVATSPFCAIPSSPQCIASAAASMIGSIQDDTKEVTP